MEATSADSSARLPLCVDDSGTIQRIKDKMKTYKKDPRKYDGYRTALANDSRAELTARLLYAETLAANCPDLNDQVSSQAALVIGNRIRKRGGDVKSVIFERDQFASSLNNYTGSRMMEFLCPKDQAVWNLAYRRAVAMLARTDSTGDFHYFFYKHHEGWDKAPWSYPENKSGASEELRACIKIFKNPDWK